MARTSAAMAERINRAHKLGYDIGRSGEAPSRYDNDIRHMTAQEKKYFQLGLIEGQIELKEQAAEAQKNIKGAGVSA